MGDAELDAHTVLVTRHPRRVSQKILEANSEGAGPPVPYLARLGTACPPHKDNSPTAVVWVVPEIIQPKVKENIFHQLNDF
jgi:hypothetical protein